MVTTDWAKFREYKDNGLVKDVFSKKSVMDKLTGEGSHSLLPTPTATAWFAINTFFFVAHARLALQQIKVYRAIHVRHLVVCIFTVLPSGRELCLLT
jgi:hypothetical protein